MGRLAGFTYRRITKKLKKAGFHFDRSAKGNHQIWYNSQTRKRTTIPNHPGNIPEGTLRAIISQADISANDFLNL